jgi:hypothetical protein
VRTQQQVEHQDKTLAFDRYQFDGRRKSHRMASRATGLSFADAGSMHVQRRSLTISRRFDSSWANSEEKIRNVLHVYMLRRNGRAVKSGSLESLREAANSLYEKCACEKSHNEGTVHRATVSRAGGLLPLLVGIIYYSLRLGEPSTIVAERFGMMPNNVRQTLMRLNHLAQKIEAGKISTDKPRGRELKPAYVPRAKCTNCLTRTPRNGRTICLKCVHALTHPAPPKCTNCLACTPRKGHKICNKCRYKLTHSAPNAVGPKRIAANGICMYCLKKASKGMRSCEPCRTAGNRIKTIANRRLLKCAA